MAEQNYKNHTRLDPAFHFFLLPVLFGLFVLTLVACYRHHGHMGYLYIFLAVLTFAVILLAAKARMYAAQNQDRIIRLEETLRLGALGGSAAGLTVRQLVALRFASDGEVVELAERARRDHMQPKQIKQAVQNWRADYERV